jgi:hypothetical protein
VSLPPGRAELKSRFSAARARAFTHERLGAQGWSIYGALRAQPVATGRKCKDVENGSNRPIGNGWQPTAMVSERMVRRGSSVRVRQRALKGPAKASLFVRRLGVTLAKSAAGQPLVNLHTNTETESGQFSTESARDCLSRRGRTELFHHVCRSCPVSAAPSFGGMLDSAMKVQNCGVACVPGPRSRARRGLRLPRCRPR